MAIVTERYVLHVRKPKSRVHSHFPRIPMPDYVCR